MYERTVWKTPQDALTHLVTVCGQEIDGYIVQSHCGIVTYAASEEFRQAHAEISCPRCRLAIAPNGPKPAVDAPPKPAPTTPKAVAVSDDMSNGPRSIEVILKEMGFPWMKPGGRQCDSCTE